MNISRTTTHTIKLTGREVLEALRLKHPGEFILQRSDALTMRIVNPGWLEITLMTATSPDEIEERRSPPPEGTA